MSDYKIETKCIQEGYHPKNGEPRVLPIAQSTTFMYNDPEVLGDLFDLKIGGHFYTRLSNPTVAAVEEKLAALEGGVGARLTASGQAATMISVMNICKAGDHVICSTAVYGGTFNLFNKTLRDMGIDFTFVEPDISAEELDSKFKPNTRAVFGETLANPSLVVLDIEKFAKAAHAHEVPFIVDNTFATPINCRPFEWGADIVVHSTSKYLDGHAVALGGAIVDSGKFNWNNVKYPMLTEPDDTYHGVVYTKQFGPAAYITKAMTHLLRDTGAVQSPMNAFLLNLGMETLHLRMPRHCENATKVAEYLKNSDMVSWVTYPGLPGDKSYELAQKYLPNGTCGVVAFGVKGGRKKSEEFLKALKLAGVVIHVADCRTCCLHPASTTHRQMNDEQLAECGISPDLIRMSVGIENPEDIIADVEQALNSVR